MTSRNATPDLDPGCIRASTVVVPPSPALPGQEHAHHELLLPMSNLYLLHRREGLDEARPGQVLLVPAGTWHRTGVCREPIHLLVVQWRSIDLAPWSLPAAGVHPDAHGRLLSLAYWLMSIQLVQDDRTQEMRRHLLRLMVADLHTASVRPSLPQTGEELVAAALTLLGRLHGHAWSLTELARHFGISATRLGQLIRRHSGQPMTEHLRRARLEHALHLIRQTRLPLQAIATRVGYRSAFHLSSSITRYSGRSPREIRREVR